MIPWVAAGEPLPSPRRALREPNGLLAAGADLSGGRLLEAYRKGIFPWFSEGQPVLWWSPDPRMVLFTDEFKVSRSLRRTLRALAADERWRIEHDRRFAQVMRECAAPRPGQDGTWIGPEIVAAYGELHRAGFAHSIEVVDADGQLVGGLYGVSIGRMFYGESMFARETDASKVALAALVATLRGHGFRMLDCQQNTAHLASLGAREIPRATFLAAMETQVGLPSPDWAGLEFGFAQGQALR